MTFDVAIIGGGVIGLAIARELDRAGVRDVVLLERHPAPGQGSTSRANGGIRAQFTTKVNIEFSKFTIAELEKLQKESDGLPGFVQAGYLLMTGTKAGEQGLRKAYELQKSCGVPVEWLSPTEVLKRAPFVREEGLRAGTFSATDGLIDPHGIVQTLWDRVKGTSTKLRFDCAVTAVRVNGDFVLSTGGGEVRAAWLVNATGPDAADTAKLLDVDLPCAPVRRNLACTNTVTGYPDVIPMCVDLDTGVLIRRESGGFLIAYSNPNDPSGRDTSLDPKFLEEVAERIGNRFPFLQSVGIDPRNCWAGLYPETPDHHAIVGPTPNLPHFLHCVGFGGHGIMHSIAAARAIAELVALGSSRTLDVYPLRFERFAEGDLIVETAVL